MKKIRVVELLANIRANIVAFVSIFMFAALGMGVFMGITWAAAALRNAAQEVIAQSNMHDIAIMFPYGVTDSDIKELRKVEGVSDVEAAYTCDAVATVSNSTATIRVQSLPSRIDTFTTVEGTLPVTNDEAAVLRFWAEARGLSIGSTIAFEHDAASEDDADGMELLTANTYTITALVDNPRYLRNSSETIGISNAGTGTIDCVAFVANDAFDAGKFDGAHPSVYITCDSLEGMFTFGSEYMAAVAPIQDKIAKLGEKLGAARYESVHGDAQRQIDEAQQKIAEGEEALAQGKEQLAEGERQIAEGKDKIAEGSLELVDGTAQGMSEQQSAQEKLEEAFRTLTEGQAQLDAGQRLYEEGMSAYQQLSGSLGRVRGDYDTLLSNMDELRALIAGAEQLLDTLEESHGRYADDLTDAAWDDLGPLYDGLRGTFGSLADTLGKTSSSAGVVASALGLAAPNLNMGTIALPDSVDPSTIGPTIGNARSALDAATNLVDGLANTTVTVDGVAIALTDVPGGLQIMEERLSESKSELDAARGRLEAGWQEYNSSKAAYDQGVEEGAAKLEESQRQLEEGQQTIEQKKQELEEGRQTIAQKEQELEEGRATFAAAQSEFNKLVRYEWTVMSRRESGGVRAVNVVAAMMDNVRLAMAMLFVVVGLFVTYSAISRLVHEQIVHIGTKKAVGFRVREISAHYLCFAGMAVLVGIALAVLIAALLIQTIVNPTAYKQFCVDPYGPHVSWTDPFVYGGLELALVLASTYFAIAGVLRRNAIELLKGESVANVKERFYERWRVWQRMSLFSQTVVNNCFNDVRRVVGTLVGVIGCTMLIITAVMLYLNVEQSFERQYQEIYDFDTIVSLKDGGQKDVESVAMALYEQGIPNTSAFTRQVLLRALDGGRASATLMVPTSEQAFRRFYKAASVSGEPVQLDKGGLWVSAAYGEHMGVGPGDQIVLTEPTGTTHTFTIAGVFDYYLIRHEFLLSQRAYREAFGEMPEPNVLLTQTDGEGVDRLREVLAGVDGFGSLVDDRTNAEYAFGELRRVLTSVVLVYLLLSGLMAIVVLLNINTMFVNEKKRELIVLMINGYSVREARAYIYRDSIALTIIGIALGVVLGELMGAYTVKTMEPELGHFVVDFNPQAALAGVVGCAVFSAIMLLIALRRISRFDLTDINRF